MRASAQIDDRSAATTTTITKHSPNTRFHKFAADEMKMEPHTQTYTPTHTHS